MAGKNGGARPGAGRKPGVTNRPQLRDKLTPKQIDTLVTKAVEKAEAGDSLLLKFMLEQIYGKAPQPLTGDKDNPVWLAGVEILDDGYVLCIHHGIIGHIDGKKH